MTAWVVETFTLSHHSIQGAGLYGFVEQLQNFWIVRKNYPVVWPWKETNSLLEDKNLSFLDNRENKIQRRKATVVASYFSSWKAPAKSSSKAILF